MISLSETKIMNGLKIKARETATATSLRLLLIAPALRYNVQIFVVGAILFASMQIHDFSIMSRCRLVFDVSWPYDDELRAST